MPLKEYYLVEKRNALNEVRLNNMNLQELRLFSIYLALIDARKPSTRIVRFRIEDFQKIMEIGNVNITYMKGIFASLLSKVVNVPLETGFETIQLFKKAVFSQDDSGEWYVEINAHDEALPLMFLFKERYFTYELWNVLSLKSPNQLRMYEVLKQYQHIGERIFSIGDLKELLGIGADEYPRYSSFKNDVLDVCQKALVKNTDIKFMFEPTGKRGKSGKILRLKFIIEKNLDYSDRLMLDDFLSGKEVPDVDDIDESGFYSDGDGEEDYFINEIYPSYV